MITLDLQPLHMTEQQFYQICQRNRDVRLERTARGEFVIMTPAGGETGKRNSSLNAQLWLWNEQAGLGEVFDSSTGFTLPNGANRSPDAAWVLRSRWDALKPDERSRFPPLCPDFVVELRSPSDDMQPLREKMDEYRSNGARLGWLIDPQSRRVEIYRPDQQQQCEVLDNPASVSGEHVLPGFVLNMHKIWT